MEQHPELEFGDSTLSVNSRRAEVSVQSYNLEEWGMKAAEIVACGWQMDPVRCLKAKELGDKASRDAGFRFANQM